MNGPSNKELFIVPFELFEKHPGLVCPGVVGHEVQSRVDVYKKALLKHPHTTLDAKELEQIIPMDEEQLERCIGETHTVDEFSPPLVRKDYAYFWNAVDIQVWNFKLGDKLQLVAFQRRGHKTAKEDLIYYSYDGSSDAIRAGIQYTLYLVHRALAISANRHLLAFIPCRPPNHHAPCHLTFNSGFCGGVNLPAIAITRALNLLEDDVGSSSSVILIIDFDFHEGNGTKDFLRKKLKTNTTSRIVMLDTFCRKAYPYDEKLVYGGQMCERIGDRVTIYSFDVHAFTDERMSEFAKQIALQIQAAGNNLKLILVSAGWDGRRGNPVNEGRGTCSPRAYGDLMAEIEKAKKPVLLFQEGGYITSKNSVSANTLVACVESCVNGFMNQRGACADDDDVPLSYLVEQPAVALQGRPLNIKRKLSDFLVLDSDTESLSSEGASALDSKQEERSSSHFDEMYVMANWPGAGMMTAEVIQKSKQVQSWFIVLVGPVHRIMLYHQEVFELGDVQHRNKLDHV